MPVRGIDHILLAMPAGCEQEARDFYIGILGLTEKKKPQQLQDRGGCWFQLGQMQLHLGVEEDFVAPKKAHPAFIVDDLAGIVRNAKAGGYRVTEDVPVEGYDRRHIYDPFGNRIELIEPHK